MKKPYLCQECGETDYKKFYYGNKSVCKTCKCAENRKSYKSYNPHKTVRNSMGEKIHYCVDCGEQDPSKFRKAMKSRCIACQKVLNKKNYEKGKKEFIILCNDDKIFEHRVINNSEKKNRILKTKFVYINGVKHYPCEKHGNLRVGKYRGFNEGCPQCNVENYVLTGKRQNPKKKKKNTVVIPEYNLVSYEEARERVIKLGIKSHSEYRAWKKRTNQVDMPSNPERTYGDKWENYYVFFGKKKNEHLSVGAKRIYEYLKRKGLKFEIEKKFDDCVNVFALKFDFYIEKYNVCIEFDGEQHFKVSNFHEDPEVNEANFRRVQENDVIKTQYCRDNGITLIRLDNYELNNNTIEWTLDIELQKIATKIAITELETMKKLRINT
jgi:very-short-patch-repair endonuclease